MSAAAIANPSTRPEILAALAEGESRIVNFFGELVPELFFRSAAGKWSPDEHLRHLTLTLNRVALGLSAASEAGTAIPAGRTYPQLVADYRAALAAGGKSPSAYVPEKTSPTAQAAGTQANTLRDFQAAAEQLHRKLDQPGWTEHRLDSGLLPHLLLGPLSPRELLFFTVYHNLHHLEGARASLEQQ